jgi:[ribosomal protein S5]-alanine N-acetyltransferase
METHRVNPSDATPENQQDRDDLQTDLDVDLSLRELRADDLAFFRSLAQDERVVRYVGDGEPWSDDYVTQRFDDALAQGAPSNRRLRWFIGDTPEGVSVALLALTLHADETEIGYWIAPAHWGNGYATQLVEHAVTVARTDGLGPVLEATVQRDNAGSRRVVERAGFLVDASTATATSAALTYRLTISDTDAR